MILPQVEVIAEAGFIIPLSLASLACGAVRRRRERVVVVVVAAAARDAPLAAALPLRARRLGALPLRVVGGRRAGVPEAVASGRWRVFVRVQQYALLYLVHLEP